MTETIFTNSMVLVGEYLLERAKRFKIDPDYRTSESKRVQDLGRETSKDPNDWIKYADCIAIGMATHDPSVVNMHINDIILVFKHENEMKRQLIANMAFLLTYLPDGQNKTAKARSLRDMMYF